MWIAGMSMTGSRLGAVNLRSNVVADEPPKLSVREKYNPGMSVKWLTVKLDIFSIRIVYMIPRFAVNQLSSPNLTVAFLAQMVYNTHMNIFILQKSITDLKAPIIRKPYDTNAETLGDFICEMVERNATAKPAAVDRIELFDAIIENGGDRFSYDGKKRKFSVADMRDFALQAFEDKIYLVKNVTKDITYEAIAQDMQLSENDEIALIKLKYVRGVIW